MWISWGEENSLMFGFMTSSVIELKRVLIGNFGVWKSKVFPYGDATNPFATDGR